MLPRPRRLPHFIRARRGAGMLEYGLLAGLVAVGGLVAASTSGTSVRDLFWTSATVIEGHVSGHAEEPALADPSGDDARLAGVDDPCLHPGPFQYSFAPVETRLAENIADAGAADGQVRVCLTPGAGGAPRPDAPWGWDWLVAEMVEHDVAYPGVTFGQSPLDGGGATPSAVTLAEQDLSLHVDYGLLPGAGEHPVAVDTWVLDAPSASTGAIVAQVSFLLDGAAPGSLIEEDIDLGTTTFDLWEVPAATSSRGFWPRYVFAPSSPIRTGHIPVGEALDHLVDRSAADPGHFVSAVAFATEVRGGTGELVLYGLEIDGLEGYASEPPQRALSAFSFPDTHLPYAAPPQVGSAYIDIEGLDGYPRPFQVSSTDPGLAPIAVRNVAEGGTAASGHLRYGTALEISAPAPGTTEVVSLTVDGLTGTWTVSREAPPRPAFALTKSNDMNNHWIDFAELGIPQKAYRFTISGTGSTNPALNKVSAGTKTDGWTETTGLHIKNTKPKKGEVETITLIIDGQTLSWDVIHSHGK